MLPLRWTRPLVRTIGFVLVLSSLACSVGQGDLTPGAPEAASAPSSDMTISPTETATVTPGRVRASVVRVIDGDTIQVSIGGKHATIRYIGIDTPETVAPGRPVDCYGPEASSRNKALVEGKIVELEKDVSETDRFGRLLRYVFVDGKMVNEVLVRDGYAQVSTFPPDVKYQGRFLVAQREAQGANRGLWGACRTELSPSLSPLPPTPISTPNSPRQKASRRGDSRQPLLCCPPQSPVRRSNLSLE